MEAFDAELVEHGADHIPLIIMRQRLGVLPKVALTVPVQIRRDNAVPILEMRCEATPLATRAPRCVQEKQDVAFSGFPIVDGRTIVLQCGHRSFFPADRLVKKAAVRGRADLPLFHPLRQAG
tara:strand:- start:52 stop:417 length:366 start_codon:yes stop_codon:yes gene_type:complete